MKAIKGAICRHRKGGHYLVVCIATHSETGEDCVVYESLDDHRMWVRPRAMFEDGRFREEPYEPWGRDDG